MLSSTYPKFWKTQAAIIKALQSQQGPMIFVAHIHPECITQVTAFKKSLKRGGWILSEHDIYYPNFGDSIACSAMFIISIKCTCSHNRAPIICPTPPTISGRTLIATWETAQTALVHDHDWINGRVETNSLHHLVPSGTGRTSNIFASSTEKAFAKSKNVHLPICDFLSNYANESNLPSISFARSNIEVALVSCGVLLPPWLTEVIIMKSLTKAAEIFLIAFNHIKAKVLSEAKLEETPFEDKPSNKPEGLLLFQHLFVWARYGRSKKTASPSPPIPKPCQSMKTCRIYSSPIESIWWMQRIRMTMFKHPKIGASAHNIGFQAPTSKPHQTYLEISPPTFALI